jgi:DNA polymerase-3 subunit delta
LGNLPETTTVIIYSTGVDLYKNKRNLTDKNKRFSDFCAKHGDVCDFAYKSATELGKSIASALAKNNCRIDRRNAEHLAEICLCDTAYIKNEIDKLSAYCRGREVTAEDIDSLCVKHIDSDGYSLALNILKDDSQFVYNRLQELIKQNYEVVEIVSIIAFSLTDIYRAKLARQSGLTAQDVAADFKYAKNREFAVKNAFSSCGNISVYQIRGTIEIFDKLDLDLKTRSMDKKGAMLALEQAVARCLMLAGGNRRGR